MQNSKLNSVYMIRAAGFVSPCRRQRGAVLLVALVFMLLTSIIATTVMRSSTLEVKMAGNQQFQEEAFQHAQAIVNAIAIDDSNMPVIGDVGYTICKTGYSSSDCDTSLISLGSDLTSVPSGVALNYQVERMAPQFTSSMPWRPDEDQATGSGNFQYVFFEVNGEYDGVASRLGRADITQGLALRVAAGGQ